MVNFSLEYFIDYTRYELYKSIYNTIKSNFVFGVGVGDIINDINSRLPTVHYDASVDLSPNSKFNTHSMYLYFLTGLGIIGFISFIYSFVSNFYYYFKRFDCYGITFLTIVLLNMSIENFFIRIWGVIFYVIFAFYNHIRIDENKY
jgi:O-antigen ligase